MGSHGETEPELISLLMDQLDKVAFGYYHGGLDKSGRSRAITSQSSHNVNPNFDYVG